MRTYLRVKNLEKHQHYKDRRPPWIKLHAEVLDDYEFGCLQDASKAHLMLIWVLASRTDNRIPNDASWIARRIGAADPVDVAALVSAGFLEVCDADGEAVQDASVSLARRKQTAMPETETEYLDASASHTNRSPESQHEERGPAVETYPAEFEAVWQDYPRRAGGNPKRAAFRAWRARRAAGDSAETIHAGVRRYAAYCEATGKLGTEFVKQAATFLGPDRHYAEPWAVPVAAVPASPPTTRAEALYHRFKSAGVLVFTPNRGEWDRRVRALGTDAPLVAALEPWTLPDHPLAAIRALGERLTARGAVEAVA